MHMKKILFAIVALSALAISCQEDDPGLGSKPTEGDAEFTFAPSVENDNIINFTSDTKAFIKLWDFGNGSTAKGDEVTGIFPLAGTYTVKLTAYTDGGSITVSQEVVIADDDPTLLDIPSYNFLTGGASDADGKTWVVDAEVSAHLGVGPGDGTAPIWYAAAPFEKNGRNLYDDEMTFNLNGFAFTHTVNDYFYANGQYGSLPGAVQEPEGGDFFVPYTPPASSKWSLADNGDGTYTLTLTANEFMGYYHGATSYLITYLTADEMHVRAVDPSNGLAWYQKFKRKGYTRPVDPPEYKIEDIFDTFDAAGSVTYTGDSGGQLAEDYDNPAPVGINTSAKVARYTKGDGQANEFSNVQIRLGYKMDIRTRNVFKMKVYIPSYNDYTTTGAEPWQSYNTLQKMVSMKLQNRDLGGNAYTTQAEVKFNDLPTNEWIELTFDFSAFSAREDFDQIVIQLGGEANFTGGIFFIDDLELLD
jgi:hypothetical protein